MVHIVRHPAGFLNSWMGRYLELHDANTVAAKNRTRLHSIASENPIWANLFGDIDAMSVEASELWYWRYANETIYDEGCQLPNYRALTYEELAAEPVRLTRQFYSLAGLGWSPAIERAVVEICRRSPSIATAWQNKLRTEHTDLVKQIIAGSPLEDRWNSTTPTSPRDKG